MNDKIFRAFDEIKAEEELKKNTIQYIRQHDADRRKELPVRRFTVAVLSALLFLFVGNFSYQMYFTPDAYVDVDVNPSIELTVNPFGRIIDVHAYNDDGGRILTSVNLKHRSYTDALTVLVEKMEKEGYILDSGLLWITVQSDKKEDELLLSVQEFIGGTMDSYQITVEQNIFSVDAETKKLAESLDISPSRYLAILEMQEADPMITIDECRNHSINELKKCTSEHEHHSNGDAAHHSDGDAAHHSDTAAGDEADGNQQTTEGHNEYGKDHE